MSERAQRKEKTNRETKRTRMTKEGNPPSSIVINKIGIGSSAEKFQDIIYINIFLCHPLHHFASKYQQNIFRNCPQKIPSCLLLFNIIIQQSTPIQISLPLSLSHTHFLSLSLFLLSLSLSFKQKSRGTMSCGVSP